jgi:hypothetical protein
LIDEGTSVHVSLVDVAICCGEICSKGSGSGGWNIERIEYVFIATLDWTVLEKALRSNDTTAKDNENAITNANSFSRLTFLLSIPILEPGGAA